MVILCHICVKWLQWFGKVALTVPRLIIRKGPVLCKVDFIGVLQEKHMPRNGKNPSLTEFAGSSFQKVRSKADVTTSPLSGGGDNGIFLLSSLSKHLEGTKQMSIVKGSCRSRAKDAVLCVRAFEVEIFWEDDSGVLLGQ